MAHVMIVKIGMINLNLSNNMHTHVPESIHPMNSDSTTGCMKTSVGIVIDKSH